MYLLGDWATSSSEFNLPFENELCLINLEGPIISNVESFKKTTKAGPNLFGSQLPESKNDFIFTLANNHFMDYGLRGAKESIDKLDELGYLHCGFGESISESRKPLIVIENGMKIGIISVCEAQFGISNFSSPGVCEFGTWVYGEIAKLKMEVDYIIVSCHAGPEDSPWPIPYFVDLYKSYIDAGASIIHGHHSHLPQGYQEYKEGLIVYGCGNFLVDPNIWGDYQNGLWSYGIKVDFNKLNFNWSVQTFEILQVKDCIQVIKSDKNHHLEHLKLCNKPLTDPLLLEAIWQEVAFRIYLKFYSRLLGFESDKANFSLIRKIYSFLRIYFKVDSRVKNDNTIHIRYHLFSCETHRQAIKTALGLLANEIFDLRTKESSLSVDKFFKIERWK